MPHDNENQTKYYIHVIVKVVVIGTPKIYLIRH